MTHASVCFFWHMHQPYYTDPVARSASMPWVRLHATKAYYDMAFQLNRFPSISATFNFTPSLLLQLEEIASGTITDVFLEQTRKPAAELTPAERAFVVQYFFAANWATMVRPYPRYQELLVKRGLHVRPDELERVAQRFSDQELTDLQVWHNLAWFGYGAAARLPCIPALREKGRGFSEQDKAEVLAAQVTIMREVAPLYRTLAERGQIELTTTPFYHPILPLLIDTETARRALPRLPALPHLQAAADADAQIRKAVEYHTRIFGHAPKGLWPSEGSVCPELVPILSRIGLTWLATDEGNLQRSVAMQQQPWDRGSMLYRPYRFGHPGEDAAIVFRDREISDAFGFSYHKTLGHLAVDDAVGRFHRIAEQSSSDHVLIPVILDGENPWEHYYQGGEEFLGLLYERLTRDGADTSGRIRLVTETMERAIEDFPDTPRLHALHTGSWINSDFGIWIGHSEDRRAWELLAHTRQRLVDIAPTLPPDQVGAAWEELYAAEGSDWFWWYGDEFETDFKLEFDRLFRTHLRNVWTRAGLIPPEALSRPLIENAPASLPDTMCAPTALIEPIIDGLSTNFFEWRGAGSIRPTAPLGAMWSGGKFFSRIAFGFSLTHLFLRLDPEPQLPSQSEALEVQWGIRASDRVYTISFPLLTGGVARPTLSVGVPGEIATTVGEIEGFGRDTIIEVAVPFERLQLKPDQEFQFSVSVTVKGMEQARYPVNQPVTIRVPDEHFDAKMWRV